MFERGDDTATQSNSSQPSERNKTAQTLYENANRLAGLSRFQEALEVCDQAIVLNHEYVDAHMLRGAIYQHHGFFLYASQDFQRVIELLPDHFAGYFLLAKVLKADSRPHLALTQLDIALTLLPTHTEIRQLRYECLIDLQTHDQLLREADEALDLGNLTTLCHKANLLAYLQKPREAYLLYQQVLELDPNHEQAQMGRLSIWLAMGLQDEAYASYPDTQLYSRTDLLKWLKAPLWTGRESLQDKTLLIYAEQGQGDTIQRSRYVMHLVEYAKRVSAHLIFQVQPSMLRLMRHAFMQDTLYISIISYAESPQTCDFGCSSLSLAPALYRLGILPQALALPYLTAPPLNTIQWQARLPLLQTTTRPRIGLSWAGGQATQDFRRSIELKHLLPLLELPNFDFVSLQLEAPAKQWQALEPHPRFSEIGSELNDFADTASALMQLDLVICVDTAISHLAGALGVPVWLLTRRDFPPPLVLADSTDCKLPASAQPEILAHEPSLWYSSMTIFRQQQFGHWTDVIENVKAQLLIFYSNDFSAKNNAASRL